jgi:AcrR family transcriptional regulator
MSHQKKPGDVRRKEILNVAEKLFIKKGVENTTIDDILQKAHISKGALYYYFKSKDQLIDSVCERFMNKVERLFDIIGSKNKQNAIEQMIQYHTKLKYLSIHHSSILSYIHKEGNEKLHRKLERKMAPILISNTKKLIEKGINQGFFKTSYPLESAIAILSISHNLGDLAQVYNSKKTDADTFTDAMFEITEGILGAKKGIFKEYMENMETIK